MFCPLHIWRTGEIAKPLVSPTVSMLVSLAEVHPAGRLLRLLPPSFRQNCDSTNEYLLEHLIVLVFGEILIQTRALQDTTLTFEILL